MKPRPRYAEYWEVGRVMNKSFTAAAFLLKNSKSHFFSTPYLRQFKPELSEEVLIQNAALKVPNNGVVATSTSPHLTSSSSPPYLSRFCTKTSFHLPSPHPLKPLCITPAPQKTSNFLGIPLVPHPWPQRQPNNPLVQFLGVTCYVKKLWIMIVAVLLNLVRRLKGSESRACLMKNNRLKYYIEA